MNGWRFRKAERVQDPPDRRIDPGCHRLRREIRFGILDSELILTEITGEAAGSGAFIPDHPDLVAANDLVPKFAIRGSGVQERTAKSCFAKPDLSTPRDLRPFWSAPEKVAWTTGEV